VELVDDYHVQSLKVRFLASHLKREVSDVAVDLSKRLAIADDGVTVEEMLRTCLRIVAHRNPVTLEEIARFTTIERDDDGAQVSDEREEPLNDDDGASPDALAHVDAADDEDEE